MQQSEYQGPVHDTSLKLQCTHHHVIEVTQRTPDVNNSNAWKNDYFFPFRNPTMVTLIILCSIYSINAVGTEQMTKPNKSKKTQQEG